MYLGIDVGTQSVKAVLYDAQERALAAVASSPLELIVEPDGTREQLAQWWLTGLGDCLSQLSPLDRRKVRAIGVSGQQHGFVALARDGEVLAPVKLWCDTATTAECAEISARLGGKEACIAELGNPILPGYTASKILWLKKHRPDAYQRMATILLPHDYINFYLTGERAMECGDASGTGLLDIRNRCWHRGALQALDGERDLASCLPQLLPADAPMGQLRSEIAAQLGLPPAIPVATGGGDNMMAAIGSGNVTEGAITISLGTSGTLFAHSHTPVVDPAGSFAAFCSSTGGWLPLVCTMNCTVATELTRELLQLPLSELEAMTEQAHPGASGVTTVPFFNGERTPNLPDARACVFGLDESNYTAANLLRSSMESSVFGLRAGFETLRKQGCTADRIRLTGGGARSASWRQIVADVFNLPVSVQKIEEEAALGAALQALWMHEGVNKHRQDQPASLAVTGIAGIVDEHLALDVGRGCEPLSERVDRYDEIYRHYQRHVQVVSQLYDGQAHRRD